MSLPRSPRAWFCVLAFAAGACTASAEEDTELPLPKWTPQELSAMRASPGQPPILGDLLGGIVNMDEAPAPRPLLLDRGEDIVGDTPDKTQPSADLSRFLPPSLLNAPPVHPTPQSPPSPLASLVEVAPEFLRDCENKPPTSRLIDPNHELSETVAEDFERFLAFHASDSRIPLALVVLGRNEKLPEGVNLARFASGGVAMGSSALVICPYGEPWRARFFVSQPLRNAVPAAYLNSLLESCIRDSLRATDPDEQMHRLLVQFSIRLFWVQRMLAPPVETSLRHPSLEPENHIAALEEVQPASQTPGREKSWPMFLTIAAGFTLLGLLAHIGWRWHRFKSRHYEWLLPSPDRPLTTRFGGPSCGGGASIRYR